MTRTTTEWILFAFRRTLCPSSRHTVAAIGREKEQGYQLGHSDHNQPFGLPTPSERGDDSRSIGGSEKVDAERAWRPAARWPSRRSSPDVEGLATWLRRF